MLGRITLCLFLLVSLAVAKTVDFRILITGTGSGSVAALGQPDVVNCNSIDTATALPGPPDCFIKPGANIRLNLRATPHSGSQFVGWGPGTGLNCTNSINCVVQVGETAMNVTAIFNTDTSTALHVVNLSPKAGSFLTLTTPVVQVTFNSPIIFLEAFAVCTDEHIRRIIPIPVDNPTKVGNTVWFLQFPEDDPIAKGATCTLRIPRNRALVPKDTVDGSPIIGVAPFSDQYKYTFNPDSILEEDFHAFYTISNPPDMRVTAGVDDNILGVTTLDATVFTGNVTTQIAESRRFWFPVPPSVVPSTLATVNWCRVSVTVTASGINVLAVAGFPSTTGNSSTIDFAEQTYYLIGRGDNAVRRVEAFTDLDANASPQNCYLLLKEVSLAKKRDLQNALHVLESTVAIGPLTQALLPRIQPSSAPTPSPNPSVENPSPSPSASTTFSPSPTPVPDFFLCAVAGGCECPLDHPENRCPPGKVAVSFNDCSNPCLISPAPSPSNSPAPPPPPPSRKKRQIPVSGILELRTRDGDVVQGMAARLTTGRSIPPGLSIPPQYTFAGAFWDIEIFDYTASGKHVRISDLWISFDSRSFNIANDDLTANYAIIAVSYDGNNLWEEFPYTIDSVNRLSYQADARYEEHFLVRRNSLPPPNPYNGNGQRGGDFGATSGGATTLFNDVYDDPDRTYGPVAPNTVYAGNYAPTPVPLVDNPYFTDDTFRLSGAAMVVPSFLIVLAAMLAVLGFRM
mmetsp:Transcript_33151/g.83311  ORF Transcript_33151/g.83311 Transcript_33151/m.83311 type:complete len:740 (-) Transcript_33151:196-2415(-)